MTSTMIFRTAPEAVSLSKTVTSFAEAAEAVADLRVHREVDETVDALVSLRKFLSSHATMGRSIVEHIRAEPVVLGTYMDPDDTLIDELTSMIERDEDYLTTMTAKKGCIDTDSQLNQSHCEMLHSAYDEALVALACLIEVAKDMRAAIVEHDLVAEPRDTTIYSNVIELRRAIG